MYIKSINIKNFKAFSEKEIFFNKPTNQAGSGINIFVGENNSGKSTLFEAINFLRNGVPRDKKLEDLKNKNSNHQDEMFVEITFSGEIKKLVDNFSAKDFGSYVSVIDGEEKIITRRSSKIYNVRQGKKDVEITPSKIGVWNFTTNQFENPSGIDADFKKFFEIDFIWSDTNPEDITKFGSATICGKLLSEIVSSFKNEKEYIDFQKAHNTAFNNPSSGLKQKLKDVEVETAKVFKEQFGFAEIEFNFDELEIESFFKNTKIKVNDGVKTDLEDKGGGMQRSVALALLQVYVDRIIKHPEIENISRPFYLFIDEPEICLHPQAQLKLFKSLKRLSTNRQIFLSSHSLHFIDPKLIQNIYKFKRDEENKNIEVFYDHKKQLSAVKENRTFFLHHRNIFFARRAVFVEGVEDLERLSIFLEDNNLEDLARDLNLLNGKDSYKSFREICKIFGINSYLITDVDYINDDFMNAYGLVACPSKEWHRGKCLEKKYHNVFVDKRKELVKDNIFILSKPDITDFLNKDGKIFEGKNYQNMDTVGTSLEKEEELKLIAGSIK